MKVFQKAFPPDSISKKLAYLETNMYAHQFLEVEARLLDYSNDAENPKLSELAKPTINLVKPEKNET